MNDVRLRRTEKNEILVMIQGIGMDPLEFEWLAEDTDEYLELEFIQYRVSRLKHRPTNYFFVFGGLRVQFSPGPESRVETGELHFNNWDRKCDAVRTWLAELHREVDAPDLWALALRDRNFMRLTSVMESGNTPFSADEQGYISTRIDEIRTALLASADVQHEQRELINAQFEYIKEASKRLGRFDWKGVLISLLISIAANALFSPDRTRDLLHMAADAFTPLYQAASRFIK